MPVQCPQCREENTDEATDCHLCAFVLRPELMPVAPPPARDRVPAVPRRRIPPDLSETALPYPIVRVSGTGKSRKWVRLTDSGLAVGKASDPVTDAALTEPGDARVPYPHIRSARYERKGSWTFHFWRRRYVVEPQKGEPIWFELWERDAENVDRALADGLGDRFERPATRVGWTFSEWAVVSLLVVAVTLTPLAYFHWGLLGLPVLVAVMAGLLLMHDCWQRDKSSHATAEQLRQFAHRRLSLWVQIPLLVVGIGLNPIGWFVGVYLLVRWVFVKLKGSYVRWRRRRGGRPFRSAVLGWSLKLLGLTYALAVLCTSEFSAAADAIAQSKQTTLAVQGPALMYGLLGLPAIALLALGARMCLRTYAPNRHADTRPPVVYLRSFEDDGRGTLQPCTDLAVSHGVSLPMSEWKRVKAGNPLVWLTGTLNPVKLVRMFFDQRPATAEDTLAAGLRPVGPFVAIGRPGEGLATSGADRMYVTDDEWQKVVLDHLDRCKAVVLRPGSSEGVRWEVERVFERVPIHRVLLSLSNFRGRYQEYDEFRHLLARRFGLTLPLNVPARPDPCFVYFEPDGTARVQEVCYRSPWVWSFTCNAVDEAATFRSFIQGLDGGKRTPPQRPQEHSAMWLSRMAAFALSVLFYFLSQAAMLATDGIRDTLRPPPTPGAVTRVGRNFPYELHLNSGWSDARTREAPQAEHELEYRDGKSKLFVAVEGGAPDRFSPTERANQLRKVREEAGRAKLTSRFSVTVERAQRRVRDDCEWHEMTFLQDAGGASTRVWVWVHMAETKSITVMVVTPNEEKYTAVAEDAFKGVAVTPPPAPPTFAPPTFTPPQEFPVVSLPPRPVIPAEQKLLADALVAKKAEYRGRAMPYTVTLPAVWRDATRPAEEQLRVMERAVGREMMAPIRPSEFLFELGTGELANIGVEVRDEELPADEHEGIGRANAEFLEMAFRKSIPMARVKFDRSEELTAGGRKWGAFELTVSAVGHPPLRHLNRYTTRNGRSLTVAATILRDTPEVRQLVREALESVQVEADELPPGYKDDWNGERVVLLRGQVAFHRKGAGPRDLGALSYVVKRDANGRLWVNDGGEEGWIDKTAAVPLDKAIDDFAARVKATPNDLAVRTGQFETYNQLKKYAEAERCMDEVIRLAPKVSAYRYNRGLSRENQGKYLEAAEDYAKATELDPEDFDAVMRRAGALRLGGDLPGAAVAYGAAIDRSPNHAELYVHRGECLLATRPKDAAEDFTKAIKLSPRYADAFHSRGRVRFDLGEYAAALKDFEETARLEPSHWAAQHNSGLVLALQGEHDEAITRFDAAIKIEPANARSLYRRGLSHAATANTRRAIADFNTAIEIDPKYADAKAELAWRLSVTSVEKLRDGKRAVELATAACAESKYANTRHLQVLAAASAEAGDFDAARKWQKKVVEKLPGDLDAKSALDTYTRNEALREK